MEPVSFSAASREPIIDKVRELDAEKKVSRMPVGDIDFITAQSGPIRYSGNRRSIKHCIQTR